MYVSWDAANAYCSWLSEQIGMTYRLPSEAEWEYAVRAGTTSPYVCGDNISKVQANSQSRYNFGRLGRDIVKTTEVGSYQANDFGLFDMHSNVWEWVEDHWHENYEGAPEDGPPWLSAANTKRVTRGGSAFSAWMHLRSAARFADEPRTRTVARGFRCAGVLE